MALTYDEIAKAQQGQSRDQIAAAAQAAVAPTPTPAPVTRYTTPSPASPSPVPYTPPSPAPAAAGPAPVDENAVRENVRKQFQSTIDAIDAEYAGLTSQATQDLDKRAAENAGMTRAAAARGGVLTSDIGQSQIRTDAAESTRNKDQYLKALANERATKVASVNGEINKGAADAIKAAKEEALGNFEKSQAILQQNQEKAKGYLQMLAESGTDLGQLGPNRAKLFEMAGLDESLGELVYNSLKPKASKIDYKAEKAADGKILLYGLDPTTGKLVTQRINFDVPEGYETTYVDGQMYFKNAAGDLIPAPMDQSLYTPDYKNYLLSKKEGYSGSFEQWQNADANRKRSVSVSNNYGLSPYQQFQATTSLQKSLQTNTKAAQVITSNYKNMKTAYDSIKDDQNINAASQAIITDFNKINDPSSVVRETEYARTPEGQSFLARLQGKYEQIVQGGAGLTKASLKEFVDLAGQFADNANGYIDTQNKQATATANAFGLNADLVVPGGTPSETGPSDPNNSLGLTPPPT